MKILKQLAAHDKSRSLFGHYMQQTWPSMWVMEKMLTKYKPDRIVELGTGNGLLSAYFMTYALMSGSQFRTIDLDSSKAAALPIAQAINSPYVDFINGDIYDQIHVSSLCNFLNSAKRPFILVDGKNPKSDEVNLYAPALRSGTFMFAHDAYLAGSIEKKKGWMFDEAQIDWSNVDRLEPYYSWSCELETRMLCMKKI